jgi:hypothetical protein
MLQPHLVSNAPGGFHEGGSLAGNESSEFSSTMSRDSDLFKPQRLEHRKRTAAAAMDANPTTYFRRRVSAMCISFDLSCSYPGKVIANRILSRTRPEFVGPRNRQSIESARRDDCSFPRYARLIAHPSKIIHSIGGRKQIR